MHPAADAFIDHVKRDRGDHLYWLQQLALGFRPHRNGVDITKEFEVDTRRRLEECNRILASYA